jgi:hypothetical protein
LQFQIRKRGDPPQVRPEFEQVGDKIISSTEWLGAERFQVLTIRDGKIADVQGCTSRRQAERFAKRS